MKIKKNKLAVLIIGVTLVVACKKYGVDVPDGYDTTAASAPSISIDTNMKNIDRSGYAKARVFPGLVDLSEPRVQNAEVTLDLNFAQQTADKLRIQVAPKPQFSTGYYAAPGELIKIVVPAAINGLSVQVGGHTDNLSGLSPLLRDPQIINVKALYPGVNYIRNLYGGTIYINAAFAIAQPVKLIISNAVVSPDFVLGTDTDSGWVTKVKASRVPWLELRTRRVVFLVPLDKVLAKINAGQLNNPTALMTEWDKKFELDFNGWMGLSDNAPDERDRSPQGPWRGVLDIQLTAGYGHSGFPFVGYNDQYWFNSFTSLTNLLSSEGMWGTYHEFGHNCQQPLVWSWGSLGETTNNLFSFKAAHRMNADYTKLHNSVTTGFPQAITYASGTASKNFNTDAAMGDPFKRMTPFVQIFEQLGYGAMTKLYTEARHAQRLANNDSDRQDFVYEKFSDFAKIDLAPFFNAWGIPITRQSREKVSSKYTLLNRQLWTYNPLNKTGGTATYTAAVSTRVVSASSPADEGAVTNLSDNNVNTTYKSRVIPSPSETYPFTFVLSPELNLSGVTVGVNIPIRGLYFNGRASTDRSGDAKTAEVLTSNDGLTYVSRGTATLPNSSARYEYNFPGGPISAKYVKVIVTAGYTANPYVAFGEINILRP